MNPRYPQQQERVSGQDRLLSQLAALKQGGSGLQQQQLAQQDQHSQLSAALQLLGLQQQGENEQGRRAFDQQQLAQSGTQFQQKLAQDNTLDQQKMKMEGDHYAQTLRLSGISDYLRMPGANPALGSKLLGGIDPTLGNIFDQNNQQLRATAISQVAPQLRLIGDPAARELHGRTLLGQYPGAYEEALAQAFPQNGAGVATPPTTAGAPTIPPELQGLVSNLQSAQAPQNAAIAQVGQDKAKQDQMQQAMDYINRTFPSKAIPSTTQQWQSQDATGQLHPFFGR